MSSNNPAQWAAIKDLCVIAFFFLLRPAECCGTQAERGTPFKLQHIKFHVTIDGKTQTRLGHQLRYSNEAKKELPPCAGVTLNFVDQKNTRKGDELTHRATGSHICPVRALMRRCMVQNDQFYNEHTRMHCWVHPKKGCLPVSRQDIVDAIQMAATAVYSVTGIDPKKVTSSSFRPGGATALLCAGVDKNTIQLLGRWRSDAIQTYLRTMATSLTSTYSSDMLKHGNFSFLLQKEEDKEMAFHGFPDKTSKATFDKYLLVALDKFAVKLANQLVPRRAESTVDLVLEESDDDDDDEAVSQ